ncbi:MAG: hypothetical protein H7145_22155 [Akkermansiaceae bacterium]|nr:hypothetical protein [Armatimonadota bacterium]
MPTLTVNVELPEDAYRRILRLGDAASTRMIASTLIEAVRGGDEPPMSADEMGRQARLDLLPPPGVLENIRLEREARGDLRTAAQIIRAGRDADDAHSYWSGQKTNRQARRGMNTPANCFQAR